MGSSSVNHCNGDSYQQPLLTVNRDASVMATNDSSIVSKRAAELAYYPEPHFLRYFVKKKKVRAPLINRGYWLRMRAIEHVVHQFLALKGGKRKVVVNLGAGYDALAFRMLAVDSDICRNTTFVDVDYRELIEKKCEMIRSSDGIMKLLDHISSTKDEDDQVLLRSDHYIAAGCDLNQPEQLLRFIEHNIDPDLCTLLFVAEVSLCYMDTAYSDSIIKLAADVGGTFCLLEQFLPRGPSHAFAKTMLAHFKKLNSPLMSIEAYDSPGKQMKRFRDAGWKSVQARSLWELWSDPQFLSTATRMKLSAKEPFDEWEDFSLFASHYLLLVASSSVTDLDQIMPCDKSEIHESHIDASLRGIGNETLGSEKLSLPELNAYQVKFRQVHRDGDFDSVKNAPSRRFGVLFEPQEQVLTLHGGYIDSGKVVGRTNTSQTLSDTSVHNVENVHPPKAVGSLMCHTATKMSSQNNCLLVGGRTTPLRPSAQCWFLNSSKIWQQVESLPLPLYRHAATSVNISGLGDGVLVFGGRATDSKASGRWLLWQHNHGWTELISRDIQLTPRFASSLATNPHNRSCGLLVGGLTEDGTVLSESYWWSVVRTSNRTEIYLENTEKTISWPFHRFGASLVAALDGYYLIGGFDIQGAPSSHREIAWRPYERQDLDWAGVSHNLALSESIILAGHHVAYHDGLLILGGGAICFSFGAYINKSVYYLTKNHLGEPGMLMNLEFADGLSELKVEEMGQDTSRKPNGTSSTKAPKTASISSVTIVSRQDFRKLIQGQFPEPFVMRSASLGSCLEKWTLQYVCSQVGADRKVTIHRASSKSMSFLSRTRNFSYVTCSFGEFIHSIENGGTEYFRALSTDERDTAANFHKDFPSLSADFHLPPQLAVTNEQLHSSVLRISGPVAMWLHYDVMANMLCQIHGSKSLVLFSPSDVKHLGIPPGGSTSNLDVFSPGAFEKEPLVNTRPWLVSLSPGDILFIPPLWLHAAEPVEGTSIAVNVFFKDMEAGYAAGRDVYANRDLQAYEEGRKDIQKIVRRFQSLPEQRSRFYLERLAQELQGFVNI